MRKLKSTDCETSLNFTERRKRGPQTLKQRLRRARRAGGEDFGKRLIDSKNAFSKRTGYKNLQLKITLDFQQQTVVITAKRAIYTAWFAAHFLLFPIYEDECFVFTSFAQPRTSVLRTISLCLRWPSERRMPA